MLLSIKEEDSKGEYTIPVKSSNGLFFSQEAEFSGEFAGNFLSLIFKEKSETYLPGDSRTFSSIFEYFGLNLEGKESEEN